MKDKINNLYNKDDNVSYNTLQELELITSQSNELYEYFDDLLNMLNNEKTFVRVRGFRLICALAKWDVDNKINNNIEIILEELDDDKGTAIRQCLDKIKLILIYKPELSEKVETKLKQLNLNKYKESMQSLIKRDIDSILKNI